MRYAYVKNGMIVEGPRNLPKSWKNVSGLNNLTDSALKELGWLPYHFIEADEADGPVISAPLIVIEQDKVIEYQQRREYTTEERDDYERQMADIIRDERNAKLSETDWTQLLDSPIDSAAWSVYRKELRDVPQQVGFPFEVEWPVPPQ